MCYILAVSFTVINIFIFNGQTYKGVYSSIKNTKNKTNGIKLPIIPFRYGKHK